MKRIAFEALLWLCSLFLAWVFVRQGLAKFDDGSGWAKAFAAWHYPRAFRLLIGALEIAAAVLLVTRRFAYAGAAIIVAVMTGAMATHVWWGHPRQITSEVLPLVLASFVAIARWRRG